MTTIPEKAPAIQAKIKTRDPYFDKFKGFLVICVILSHFVHDIYDDSPFREYLYMYLMMFAVPAFVFMSGYFSRNVEKCRRTAVQTFLIPYLIYDLLFACLQYAVLQPDKTFHNFLQITRPKWGLWYLFAMFIYRLFASDIKKVRSTPVIAFIIGIGAGFCGEFSTEYSLGRVFSLCFFFVLGLSMTEESMDKVKHFNKAAAVIILIALAFLIPFLMNFEFHSTTLMTHETILARKPYGLAHRKLSAVRRIIFYLLGTLMTYMLMVIMPRTKSILTQIGKNSITAYVFHLFILWPMRQYGFFDLQFIYYNPAGTVAISVIISFLIAFLLSREPVRKFYDFIVNGVNKIIFREKAV